MSNKGRRPHPNEKCQDCGCDPGMLIYPVKLPGKKHPRFVCFSCWKDRNRK